MAVTQRTRPPRLPTPPTRPSRAHEIFRGLLALIATALILIGVPLALWAAFGNPLPDSAPSQEWLTAEISSSDLLRILALVVWLAWQNRRAHV